MMTREGLRYLAKIGGTLRTGEVAEVLGITSADVRRLMLLSDGLQPIASPGRQRQWSARIVEEWMQSHPRYGNR